MIYAYIATFLVTTLGQQPKPATPTHPIAVTICELNANPTTFDGKLIIFKAEFESDGIERSLLIDKSCPDKTGPLPYVPDGSPGAKAFDDAIETGRPGTLDKTITATFTGIFHYLSKPEMCNFISKDVCRRTITVTRIQDLVLIMKQKE
jgi:hypothetical protein